MTVESVYAGKVRIRVCGLLRDEDKLLLVKVHSPVTNTNVWMPPGGGVDVGEPMKQALVREFYEETNLEVEVGELIHISELIESPFHAIQFFFSVQSPKGNVQLGIDPEHSEKDQILKDIRFISREEMSSLNCTPDFIKKDYWNGVKGSYSLK